MTNKEKYDATFIKALSITESQLGDELVYNSVAGWDSIGHMELVAALETTFDILMEMEDIIDFDSYNKGFELVAKYGVKF